MEAAALSTSASAQLRPLACAVSSACQPLSKELCAALEAEWSDLAHAAGERNLFQVPWFIDQSLALLRPYQPEVITIHYDQLLIGMVILRRDVGYAKLPIPFWRSAMHHEQYLGTPLVRAGFEDAFVSGLADWIDTAPADCVFAQLSMITADGPLAKAIADHCERDDRMILTANHYQRAAIAPAARRGKTAEDLLSPSRRKSLKRAMSRLQKQGDVSIERLCDRDQVSAWTEQFLAMENTGWKRDQGSSILSCADETALYRAVIAAAFEAGDLHFARLCLDRKPIAYTLDIAAAPIGFCLKSAIDQDYRKFSPGVLMEFETLKYYLSYDQFELVDSCSAPDNELLNDIWPDRKQIMDIAIARKGLGYGAIFKTIKTLKSLLKTAPAA